jgi:drug/metabolite transporter (DMT)-like permease
MLRGGTIVTTFIFSITILKTKPQAKMVIGSILALVGVAIVGISNFKFSSSTSSDDAVYIY